MLPRTANDIGNPDNSENLDQLGDLIQHVALSIVLASFNTDGLGEKARRDFLQPVRMSQDTRCCRHFLHRRKFVLI